MHNHFLVLLQPAHIATAYAVTRRYIYASDAETAKKAAVRQECEEFGCHKDDVHVLGVFSSGTPFITHQFYHTGEV